MADSDFTQRGSGLITPVATLTGAIGYGANTLTIANYTADTTAWPALGCAVMVDNEIMKLTAFALDEITVERGCADTIPAVHLAGSAVWFFDSPARVGTDANEYIANEDVAVKVLMRTSGKQMDVKNAPPNDLHFQGRFAAPYPPGRMRVNGTPWYDTARRLDASDLTLALSWAHRDRVTQDDQLFGHEVASIGPEAGVTYTVKVCAADDTVVKTYSGIAGPTWNYTFMMGVADLDGLSGSLDTMAYLLVYSKRGTHLSLQPYRINFNIRATESLGWGNNWGNNFGGSP